MRRQVDKQGGLRGTALASFFIYSFSMSSSIFFKKCFFFLHFPIFFFRSPDDPVKKNYITVIMYSTFLKRKTYPKLALQSLINNACTFIICWLCYAVRLRIKWVKDVLTTKWHAMNDWLIMQYDAIYFFKYIYYIHFLINGGSSDLNTYYLLLFSLHKKLLFQKVRFIESKY